MLKRKMFRDFRQHSGQFISIFLLSFLAICLFTGVAGEVAGVVNARNTYHEKTNLADGWIYGENFTVEQVKEIASLDGVEEAQKRFYVQGTGEQDTTVFLYFQDENLVNMPLVLEGKDYDPSDAESIWLCQRFAMEQNISLGDLYTVSVYGAEYHLKVAGFVWSPEYEYYKNEVDMEPDYFDTGYGFASIYALPEEKQRYNQINFTTHGEAVSNLENDIAVILDNKYSVLLGRDGIVNLTILDDEVKQHEMMAILFPAFFVVIAVLTTITTMKRIVDRQRIQIGTFKAVGMEKRKIYLHYLGYGFFPSLAGAITGTIIGPLSISPLLFRMKYYLDSSDEYMLPHFDIAYPFYFWVLGIMIVGLCTLSTWFSCRKILKIKPAAALRPAQPKSAKKTIFEKLPFWPKISFSGRYNLRDIARNKARTIFGLAGTISCMALLLCAFTAKDNFQNAVSDLYVNKLMNNSSMVTISQEIPIEEAQRLRDIVNGELVMSDTTEIRIPGNAEKHSYHINVYEQGQVANVLDEQLKVAKISGNDFTLTQKAADALGVSVGDTIEWHLYGSAQWVTSKVTMITRAPFEQGIVATRQVIEEAGYMFTPTRLITQQDIDERLKQQSSYIDSVTTKEAMTEMLSNYMELVNMVMGFMLVFALFLAVIVLYSLGLLSFEERQREMATLKVLGFDSGKLRNLMLQQNIILSVIGAIIGIPFGVKMLEILINSLGDSMDIPTSCQWIYILISFAITVVISVVVNRMFSRRIKRMDMVAEIKAAE